MEEAQATGDTLDLMNANQCVKKVAPVKYKTYYIQPIGIRKLGEILQYIAVVHPWTNHISVQAD